MTKTLWLSKVEANREHLLSIIRDYHPRSPQAGQDTTLLPVTAPAAEATRLACLNSELGPKDHKFPPAVRFERALLDKNVRELCTLFDETWMGVPESRSCWQIPGFTQMVDLMEDTPQ